LTRTFRCAQGISDVASQFVMRNRAQFQKKVVSVNPRVEATIEVRWATRDTVQTDLETWLREELTTLERSGISDSPSKPAVFVLGRFNNDCPACLKEARDARKRKRQLEGCALHVVFKTMHRAKGLEAEVVIINDVHGGQLRFPMVNTDDPVIRLVLPEDTSYPFAEERRLLYVALTRAKRKVIVVADANEKSPFVSELLAMNHPAVLVHDRPAGRVERETRDFGPCPICLAGRLMRRSSKRGDFVGCSLYRPPNAGPGCSYKRELAPLEAQPTEGRADDPR
jgi:DNA helicase IV